MSRGGETNVSRWERRGPTPFDNLRCDDVVSFELGEHGGLTCGQLQRVDERHDRGGWLVGGQVVVVKIGHAWTEAKETIAGAAQRVATSDERIEKTVTGTQVQFERLTELLWR